MQALASPLPSPRFSVLYREHVAFVRGAIRRLGVPSWLEEDAVQDVFVVAHRHLRDFTGERHDGWLLVIARRVAFRHRRTALRQRRKLDALRLWLGLAPVDRPWQAPEARLLLRELADRLGRDQHEAFERCEVLGYTALEAATQLGLNPNTVSTRLRAARHELERALVDGPARHSAAPPSRAAFARGWLLLWPRLVTGAWWPATQASIWAIGTAAIVATTVAAMQPSPPRPAAASHAAALPDATPPAAEAPAPAEVPPADVPAIATPAERPAEVIAPPIQRPGLRRPPADTPADADDPALPLLGAEELAAAWQAIDRGHLDEARRLVDAHERRYPETPLATERARIVQRLAEGPRP